METEQNNGPLVTVLVGCFNHARFVEECLESVRNQTYHNWELIVFDDCSSDNSVEVIRAWIERTKVPCRFIQHTRNMGLCKSLNEVIPLARGKYINGVAADDVWLSDKLETQVAILEKLPEKVGVVYSDAHQMDEQGKALPEMFIAAHRKLETFPQGNINDILWQGNFIPAMTTMTRRKCFDEVGLYDESLAFEDWDMWLRISEKFEFVFSPKPSARYRIVGTSMMRSQTEQINDSTVRVFIKFLEAGKLQGARRAKAIKLLSDYAETLYRRGDPQGHEYLRRALRFRKSPRVLLISLLSAAGVPGPAVRRLFRALKSPSS